MRPFASHVQVGRITCLLVALLTLMAFSIGPAAAQGTTWQFSAGSIIHSAAATADGQKIILGTRESQVICLDSKGKELWRYPANGSVLSVAVSADGSRVIAASEGRALYLLDGAGKLVWQKDYDYSLISTAISGAGDLIGVVPRKFKTVWVLDGNGKDAWSAGYDVNPTTVAISADGKRVAFGTRRNAWIHLYDNKGAKLSELQFDGVITNLAFSKDGSRIALSDESHKGYAVNVDPASNQQSIAWDYKGEDKMEAAAVTYDGQHIAFGNLDKNAYLLDGSGKLTNKTTTGGAVYAVALSGDGSTYVVGSDDGKVAGYNVKLSNASFAAGQQQALTRAIVIPALFLLLIVVIVALLRWTRQGQEVWRVQGAAPRRLAQEIWRARMSYLLLLPTIALLLVFNYYPAFSGLFHSFTKWSPGLPDKWIGLQNFQALFNDDFLRQGLINCVILVVTSLPIKVITVPLLVAELLFALRSHLTQYWLRSLFIFPIVVPGVAAILVWRNIYDPNIGLLNNLLAPLGLINLQQPMAWLGNPTTAIWAIVFVGFPWVGGFALLLYYGGLISIPVELFDAAKVDGSSGMRRFWSIDLPLLMGQIKLLLILSFIGGVQEFGLIFLLTEGGPYNKTYTPALELYYQAMRFNNFGLASAIGTVMFLVILGGTILNLRYVRSSTEFQA